MTTFKTPKVLWTNHLFAVLEKKTLDDYKQQVLIELTEEGTYTLVATNGHCLHIWEFTRSPFPEAPTPGIYTLSALKGEPAYLWTLISKDAKTRYPNYRRVLPQITESTKNFKVLFEAPHRWETWFSKNTAELGMIFRKTGRNFNPTYLQNIPTDYPGTLYHNPETPTSPILFTTSIDRTTNLTVVIAPVVASPRE